MQHSFQVVYNCPRISSVRDRATTEVILHPFAGSAGNRFLYKILRLCPWGISFLRHRLSWIFRHIPSALFYPLSLHVTSGHRLHFECIEGDTGPAPQRGRYFRVHAGDAVIHRDVSRIQGDLVCDRMTPERARPSSPWNLSVRFPGRVKHLRFANFSTMTMPKLSLTGLESPKTRLYTPVTRRRKDYTIRMYHQKNSVCRHHGIYTVSGVILEVG